jgi:DNA-binding transcriptional regulator YiaG
MAIATIVYDIQIDHDGRKYQVHIPSLTVPKCSDPVCGEISIDDEASEQIDCAFRRVAKLLRASEIREGRIRAGFPQQSDFAMLLGIGVSTLSRWETGRQVQQRAMNDLIKAFFDLPELQDYYRKLRGLSPTTSATNSIQAASQ